MKTYTDKYILDHFPTFTLSAIYCKFMWHTELEHHKTQTIVDALVRDGVLRVVPNLKGEPLYWPVIPHKLSTKLLKEVAHPVNNSTT